MTIDTQRLATDPEYWRECGATEGATHYIIDLDPELNAGSGFFVEEDCKYRECESSSYWSKGTDNPLQIIPRPRPKTASEEWDGKSAPAPGELASTSGGKCRVIGWDSKRKEVAVQWQDGEMGVIRAQALKPFFTKQERQRDELADLIADNIEITLENDSFRIGAGKAVDAIIADGWTKP